VSSLGNSFLKVLVSLFSDQDAGAGSDGHRCYWVTSPTEQTKDLLLYKQSDMENTTNTTETGLWK